MLYSRDIALVASKLEVPIIVSDLLHGLEPMTDEAEYALHEALSEMQPDTALLCVAMCGAKFVNIRGLASTPVRILALECNKIIEDYAQLWLHNAQNRMVDEDRAREILSGAAEDLEDLAGLLDNCMYFLERTNGDAAILCDILRVQARAHAVIADAYFESIEETFEEEAAESAFANTNNVIPFPVHRTA